MPGGADEIIRVSRQSNSGTYAYFREAVLGKGRDFKLGSRDMQGSKDVVELVSKTPGAIGYSGMGYATPEVKMLRVAKTGGRAGVRADGREHAEPHLSDCAARCSCTRWASRPGAVKKYLDWVHSDAGQKIVGAERLRAARRRPDAK